MIEIKDLLSRFSNILLGQEGRIEEIRKIISETIGINIKKEEMTIKDGVIYLKIKPIYKNEILMKEEQIFSRLESVFGKKHPKKIR